MTVNRSDFANKPQRSSVDADALGIYWDPTDPQGEPFVAPMNAHDASAISFSATGTISSTDVQAAIAEVASEAAADLAAHLADTTDAHDASAVSVLDTPGNWVGTNAEAVLAEIPSRFVLASPPVANYSRWYQQGFNGSGVASANYRWKRVITAKCGGIRLVYGNHAGIETSATPPSTITVKAGFEDAAGTKWPVFFNGKRSVDIEPYGVVISDPLDIDLEVGDACWVRTFVSGSQWPVGPSRSYTGEGGDSTTNATDQTLTGTISTSSVYMYGPLTILGNPYDPTAASVIGYGDSIMFGQGDSPALGYPTSGPGFFDRAMNNAVMFTNCACSGDGVINLATNTGHRVRFSLARGHKYAVFTMGTNDIVSGNSLATIQAAMISAWRAVKARGPKVYQATIVPRPTASTDGYITEAGQTVAAQEGVRTSLNTWIGAGAPLNPTTFAAMTVGAGGSITAGQNGHPLIGTIDVAIAIEGAIAGTWKQDATRRTVTDGAISSGGTAFTSATAAFTSADLNKTIQVPGAGSAGATLYGIIYQIDSATQVRVSPAAGTTVSGATCVIAKVLTSDGTHPSVAGHIDMATTITPSTLFT